MEIRPVNSDEFPAFLRTTEGAFHEDVSDEDVASWAKVFEPERSLAVLEDGAMVATAAALTRELTLPGARMSVACITAVGVLPTHRRRGLLTELMRRQLDDVRAAGESVAALWASEPVIYGRFGYGLAARHGFATVPTTGARLRAGLPAPAGRTVLLEPADAVERIAPLYDRVRRERVGHLDRAGAWWDLRVYDPEAHRAGRGALRAAVHEAPDGTVDGYVLYGVKLDWSEGGPNSVVVVRELVTDGPAAVAGVWSYLLGLDLTRSIEAWPSAPDLPPNEIVEGPQRPRMTLGSNLWVRLVDVGAALAARTYNAPFAVVFEVEDAFCRGTPAATGSSGTAPSPPASRPTTPPTSRSGSASWARRTWAARASPRSRRSAACASCGRVRSTRSRSRSGPRASRGARRCSERPERPDARSAS